MRRSDKVYATAWILFLGSAVMMAAGQFYMIPVFLIAGAVAVSMKQWRREAGISEHAVNTTAETVPRRRVEKMIRMREDQGYRLVSQSGNRKVTLAFRLEHDASDPAPVEPPPVEPPPVEPPPVEPGRPPTPAPIDPPPFPPTPWPVDSPPSRPAPPRPDEAWLQRRSGSIAAAPKTAGGAGQG
jgi:hypothetical protein